MHAALLRTSLVSAVAAALLLSVGGPASADPPDKGQDRDRDRVIARWIDRTAHPLGSADPAGPIDDLGALRTIAGRATVVGLGESTHGSRTQFRTKLRMVRFLVERMGFRTIGLEHDFAQGTEIDHYVVTGEGNARELVVGMGFPFWVCEEMVDLVEWMRAYNVHHPRDTVRFLGTDVIALRDLSFDQVTGYVRRFAPDRLAELERMLEPIRPTGPDHTQWYQQLPPDERLRLIDLARRASRLVQEVPPTAPRLDREYAEQHARAIVGWYEAFDNVEYGPEREVFVADTIGWWQRTIGGKVAYWAANIHVTSADAVTYRHPAGGWTGRTAGGFLADRLGDRYVTVASVFGQGTISSDYVRPGPHPIGPPPAGLLDRTLGTAEMASRTPGYLLDLHARAPHPVRAWREGTVAKRMILPSYVEDDDGSGYVMTVPSLVDAFDAVVYVRTTTASHLLV
jgi:erythromycin esterase